MAEQFEEVYVYVSTHGDGPKIDNSLAKALSAVQEDEFAILESRVSSLEDNPLFPLMPEIGNILIAADGGVAEQASIYPIILRHIAAGLAAVTLALEKSHE
jgi:hypothetical protein